MCGILGQINKKGHPDKKIFSSMLRTLFHRGPDQMETFYDGSLALGHTRLSIIDLSPAGTQPMFNEDGTVALIFNGEIYNYLDIKKRLQKNHIWKSKTDSETLIHGYEQWGQAISEKIEGMFAFAIYDKERQLITVSRDHFGKKPLYYYLDEEIFCFASEIKAIITHPQIKKKLKIDRGSLTKFLFYGYIPSPHSVWDGIKKLEPSTTFQFDIENWKIINKHCYWKLEDVKLINTPDETQILEKTEKLIKKSVEKRLMSDVPLGIFLSGGVDSSLIATYLSQYSSKVSSFTVCYKDSPEIDESKYAKRVADTLGITNNLCFFESKQVRNNFIQILDYLDEPLADAAIIPLFFISKFAKNKISVALSGDGGDELFGGYPKYNAQKFIENFSYLSVLVSIIRPFISKNNTYYKLFDSFTTPFPVRQFLFGSGSLLFTELQELLNVESVNFDTVFEDAIRYEKIFKQKDIVNKSLFLDCKIQLPDWYLVKGDRATMATSLEMRNPLLDKELAEFAFSLKGDWKIRKNTNKYILKKLAGKYIDPDIIYRKKSGFGVPLDKWIRSELKDLFDEYLFIDHGYFNKVYIMKIYKEHIAQEANHQFKLLRIFSFNYWYKKYYG